MTRFRHRRSLYARRFAAIALAVGVGGCCPSTLRDGTPVQWPGQLGYADRVDDLDVSPTEAYNVARKAAEARGQQVLAKEPLLLVEDAYLFGVPNPRGVWLTGYYVNGHTGQVEYRQPDRMLYCGPVAGPVEGGEPFGP